jgi:hypothetical protein
MRGSMGITRQGRSPGEGSFDNCCRTREIPWNSARPRSENGVYLLKGGGLDVWRKFGVPRCWRKPQGIIHGKRCGTTENIGSAARRRWTEQQRRSCEAEARAA